jgi:hypothetical protein
MPASNKEQAQIVQAYQTIFLHTPQGQIILADLMKACGLFNIAGHRPNSELQHMAGSQDMVRRCINLIGLSEEQVLAIALGRVQPIEQGEYADE